MRRPSTRMSSCAGSALVPSSRMVSPLTVTRPSTISCSDARRDATPARDRIFCSRSIAHTYHDRDRLHCSMDKLVIAIDGPSGAGKGTVARAVAAALGYRHVDSGAMYRAVGWKALRDGVPLDSDDGVAALAERSIIDVTPPLITIDGSDVTRAI